MVSLNSKLDPLRLPAGLRVSQAARARYELRERDPNHVLVYVDFRLDGQVEESEGMSFGLEATFLLVYRLESAATYPTDALTCFAQLNGPYNAWPYWRELVGTATARMGLSPFTVPVFRPQISEIDEQADVFSTETATAASG